MNIRNLAVAIILVPQVALAHSGPLGHDGFVAGLMHPLTGLDHLATMIAVGILGATLGGRAIWLLPLSFVAVMVGGALIGMLGLPLFGVEAAIVLGMIALGAMLLLPPERGLSTALALVAGAALFHGHAHGAELPHATSPAHFIAGFVASTSALLLLGTVCARLTAHRVMMFRQSIGLIIAGIGVLTGAGML
jgi:urease accessory protein